MRLESEIFPNLRRHAGKVGNDDRRHVGGVERIVDRLFERCKFRKQGVFAVRLVRFQEFRNILRKPA